MIRCVLCLGLLASFGVVADPNTFEIGNFSKQDLKDWESKSFEGETDYRFASEDGKWVLQASSSKAASGLFREITVDLKKYPYLNWQWQTKTSFPEMDESEKPGDDYVARIYVVKSGGLWFWKTKALNYVWSSQTQPPESWPNAFAPANTRMLAVRSARDKSGVWYREKRNIYQDLKDWLGEEVEEIDAVAIMTDTDNSGLSAEALYGDIYFSKE